MSFMVDLSGRCPLSRDINFKRRFCRSDLEPSLLPDHQACVLDISSDGCLLASGTHPDHGSAIGDDQPIEPNLRSRKFNPSEARILRNALELYEGIGVAPGCGGQHHHTECSSGGRRDAVGVRNKFSYGGATTRLESTMDLAHKTGAGWRIEVVQEIRDQHQIIVGAKVSFEGTPRQQVIA